MRFEKDGFVFTYYTIVRQKGKTMELYREDDDGLYRMVVTQMKDRFVLRRGRHNYSLKITEDEVPGGVIRNTVTGESGNIYPVVGEGGERMFIILSDTTFSIMEPSDQC
jgi:hypothetical protein